MRDACQQATPPPASADEFPLMIQSVMVTDELLPQPTPPPMTSTPVVEFPLIIQLVRVMEDPSHAPTPPPSSSTTFSAMVQSIRVTEHGLIQQIPPPHIVVFCTIAQFLTVPEEASNKIPPPHQALS
jgi:hypothetical protein